MPLDGGVERKGSIFDCAKREVMEETGRMFTETV